MQGHSSPQGQGYPMQGHPSPQGQGHPSQQQHPPPHLSPQGHPPQGIASIIQIFVQLVYQNYYFKDFHQLHKVILHLKVSLLKDIHHLRIRLRQVRMEDAID